VFCAASDAAPDQHTTERTAISHARNQVLGAVRFLDWLALHDRTLAACTQGDLDLWLATGPRSRHDVHHFVQWTSERKLTTNLVVPPVRSGPGTALDAEQRWAIIATLLHDPGIEVADRVAGSFVLLYAQPLSRVAVMTVDAVTTTGSSGASVRLSTPKPARWCRYARYREAREPPTSNLNSRRPRKPPPTCGNTKPPRSSPETPTRTDPCRLGSPRGHRGRAAGAAVKTSNTALVLRSLTALRQERSRWPVAPGGGAICR
jgi:hypothetical protein